MSWRPERRAPVAEIGVPGEARLAGVIEQPSCVPGATLASKGCSGAEPSHPLFSAAKTQRGSTSLAMTVWYVGIYLLENWSSALPDASAHGRAAWDFRLRPSEIVLRDLFLSSAATSKRECRPAQQEP